MLTALGTVGFYCWRLSFSVLPCISSGVRWRIGRGVGGSVGSKVDQLHYFIFTSSLFSHGLKRALLRRHW
jgi:hypothetical protein